MNIDNLQIPALQAAYESGRLTPSALVAALGKRIAGSPAEIWISRVSPGDLLKRAQQLEAAGCDLARMPLYGIPFAVKDNIDVAGMPTTAACPDYACTPAEDAPVVRRLLEAGAILVGKTNLDQFATGLVGVRSPYGVPRCVFDREYISGGSSSGSAVSVAGGLASFSLGTDTAGSGRVPAAFNNLVGVKPTKGLLSTRGVVPACRSLDCVTVFAASCGEADLVRRIAEGFDESDPYSRRTEKRGMKLEGFRFGVLPPVQREFFGDGEAARLYQQAVENLAGLGGTAVQIDYAPFKQSASLLYSGPWVAERLAAIEDFLDTHPEALDPTVRTIIEGARTVTAVDAFRGQYALMSLQKVCEKEWEKMDVLLLPTAPTIYKVSEVQADPIRLNSILGTYTNFVNLLDCCAVAIPAGFRGGNGLPFGVTLVARSFADDDLAVLADRLHRAGSGSLKAGGMDLPLNAVRLEPSCGAGEVRLAVVGAHLSGEPLNFQLTDRGARLLRTTRTAADYRLYALGGTVPPKPGLFREPGYEGAGLVVEVWALSEQAFGSFVAEVPPPLGIGNVTLQDGSVVKGFICEPHARRDAEEITAFGGWKNYRAQQRAGL